MMTKVQTIGIAFLLVAIFGAIQTQGHDTSTGSWMYADMTTYLTKYLGLSIVLFGDLLTKQPTKHDTTPNKETTHDKVNHSAP